MSERRPKKDRALERSDAGWPYAQGGVHVCIGTVTRPCASGLTAIYRVTDRSRDLVAAAYYCVEHLPLAYIDEARGVEPHEPVGDP